MVGIEYTLQKKGQSQHERQDKFLSQVSVLPIDSVFELMAQEKARLQMTGTPVSDTIDALIACMAIQKGMVMVTENLKHFQHFKGIQLENWVHRE